MTAISGSYINLERSPGRAAFMQEQLARLGLAQVTRHAAVDGATLAASASPLLAGERGCFLSHLQLLEAAAPDRFTLVLEDDMELSEQLPELVGKAIAGPLADIDIAFLECQPHFAPEHLSLLWQVVSRMLGPQRRAAGVELMDARALYKWGTGAYVVSPPGRLKLLALMRTWLQHGPLLPLDRCIENAVAAGQLRAVITMPFLATTALRWHGRSGIGDGLRTPPPFLMLLRRVLYAGSLEEALPLAEAVAARPVDPALRMFGLAVREVAAWQRQEQQGLNRP